MNLHNIITSIEKTDPEVYDRLDSRRSAMKSFAKIGGKIAMAAVPIALGSMFKKAYSQTTTDIEGVLQYALTLEYLEYEFYQKGSAAANLVPAGAPAGAIATIRDHELAHVNFLKAAITSLGKTPVSKPNFDFSAGSGSMTGPLATVFTDYPTFLAVAQTFEDTGVRAYKGQAANLISNNDVLTAALNIHSVEARHAAHIRYMRRNLSGSNSIKPWITLKDTGGIGALVQKSYDGEEVVVQAGVTITNINGKAISAEAASEAFDEPLTMAQVLEIVTPFLAP